MKSAACTTLALALAAACAHAQEFSVSLNTGYSKVQATPKNLAYRGGVGSGPKAVSMMAPAVVSEMDVVTFDNGVQVPLGLNLCMKMGDNSFALDVMTTSKTTTQTELGPNLTFGSPVMGGRVDRIDGENEQKAWVADLVWSRPLATLGAASFGYQLGVRYGSWTANTMTTIDTLPNGNYSMRISNAAKTEAYGLLFGLNTRYNFSPRLWFTADLNLAVLQGDVEGVLQMGDPVQVQQVTNTSRERSYRQMDVRVRLNLAVTKKLGAHLGYEMRDFGQVTADAQVPMFAMYNVEPNRGWGSLNGFTAGVSYTF